MAEIDSSVLNEDCHAVRLVVDLGESDPRSYRLVKTGASNHCRATLETRQVSAGALAYVVRVNVKSPIWENIYNYTGCPNPPLVPYVSEGDPSKKHYLVEAQWSKGITRYEEDPVRGRTTFWSTWRGQEYSWSYGWPRPTLTRTTHVKSCTGQYNTDSVVSLTEPFYYNIPVSWGWEDSEGRPAVFGAKGEDIVRVYENDGVSWVKVHELRFDPDKVKRAQLFNWDDCDDDCVPVFKQSTQAYVCVCRGTAVQGSPPGRPKAASERVEEMIF